MALNLKDWMKGLFGDHATSSEDVNDQVERVFQKYPSAQYPKKGGTLTSSTDGGEEVVFIIEEAANLVGARVALDKTFSTCLCNSNSHYVQFTVFRRRNSTTSVSATKSCGLAVVKAGVLTASTLAGATSMANGAQQVLQPGRVGGNCDVEIGTAVDCQPRDVITVKGEKDAGGDVINLYPGQVELVFEEK